MANRLPIVMVSAMDCLTQGYNFIVSLNEFTYGFQNVSGFSIKRNVDYIREGGVNDHEIMVGMPCDDRPTLEFERGLMVHSTGLPSNALRMGAARLVNNNQACQAALIAASSLDPQEALETGPAIGLIRVYDRLKKLRAMYSFLSLGMVNWSMSNLDARSGEVMIETFSVAHTGLTRIPMYWPSGVGAIKSLTSDSETQKNAELAESIAKANEEKQNDIKAVNEASETISENKSKEEQLLTEKQNAEQELEDYQKTLEELNTQLDEAQKAI